MPSEHTAPILQQSRTPWGLYSTCTVPRYLGEMMPLGKVRTLVIIVHLATNNDLLD